MLGRSYFKLNFIARRTSREVRNDTTFIIVSKVRLWN